MERSPELSGMMISRFDSGVVFSTLFCQDGDDNEIINILASTSGNLLSIVEWLLDDNDPETEIFIHEGETSIKKSDSTIEIQYHLDWQKRTAILDKNLAAALFHMAYSLKVYLLVEQYSKQGSHEQSKKLIYSTLYRQPIS